MLSLRYYDDKVLRTRCKAVKEITPEVKKIVSDMIDTVIAHDAIGLAANQVGILLRIFIIRPYEIKENNEYSIGDSEVYINPVLSNPTKEKEILSEGCLSIPKFYPDIERPLGITIEALNEKGEKIKQEIKGFKARQIMHENDHINGVLFIDRMKPKDRKLAQPMLNEIKKTYKTP